MVKRPNMNAIGLLRKKRRNMVKSIFEEIMAKNFPKVINYIQPQI